MKTWKLLGGRVLDLRRLTARERAFLRDLRTMVRAGADYFDVYRAACSSGSIALQGSSRVDERIASAPLYLAARDIATRAGIAQGLVLAPEHDDRRAEAPTDASMMSVAQAADLIGISRAAVYKAIDRGTLRAQRIGNVTIVERASARSYRRDREAHEPGASESRAARSR